MEVGMVGEGGVGGVGSISGLDEQVTEGASWARVRWVGDIVVCSTRVVGRKC